MLCTLFQRVNVYEEEVGHHKTELSKKQAQDSEGDGSGDGDESNDSDEVTEASYLAVSSDLNWLHILTHTHHYSSPVDWYSYQAGSQHTPPPEV